MKDLSKRTVEQREKDIAYLSSLPLKELRKRQNLITDQKRMAYNRYIAAKEKGIYHEHIGEKNLDIMWEDLFEAIDRKEFKKPLWGKKK